LLIEKEREGKEMKEKSSDEPTCRCHQNPFIGALGIQQPVILGELSGSRLSLVSSRLLEIIINKNKLLIRM